MSTFYANPERITTVVADIVEHFYSTVDPQGMKAQVVVFDWQACVDYLLELRAQLQARHEAGHPLDEAAVVMSGGGKEDPPEWGQYMLSEVQEEALLKRFRTHVDPLEFLMVTSKLGTGFNAPIEGVMYLDKPLKEHTLFETITRTNRNWRNPKTGWEKRYGLIVDYVGRGAGFARAVAPANADQEQQTYDVDGLRDQFESELAVAMHRFAGIDHKNVGPTTLRDALGRLPDDKAKLAFATQFRMLEGIWETIYPDARLRALSGEYRRRWR